MLNRSVAPGIVLLLLLTARIATADPHVAAATAQVREKLQLEWQTYLAAPKTHGRWRVVLRGASFAGDWVVHSQGWSYLVGDGKRQCSVQWTRERRATSYLMCGDRPPAELTWSASTTVAELHDGDAVIGRVEITADARPPRLGITQLAQLTRAVSGSQLAITIDDAGIGHAVVETIVSTPPTDAGRQSWRYAIDVTLTMDRFAMETPKLIERYDESCSSVTGCHDVYWTCRREM